MKNPYDILDYPLRTEKAVREVEANNCIIFIVKKNTTKKQIKWAVEKAFDVKVVGIRTMIDSKGRKRAYVKLSLDTPAIDISTELGMV
ncbi:MAG: 50S ribosomal protein L23 [Candidatus Woesearchaeota archaeon]|nr:MAG: 50S ribosomal protein L23 [Candidatus Woesearchaeota archaeon]